MSLAMNWTNSSNSTTPLPSTSTSLIMSCTSLSVGFWPIDRSREVNSCESGQMGGYLSARVPISTSPPSSSPRVHCPLSHSAHAIGADLVGTRGRACHVHFNDSDFLLGGAIRTVVYSGVESCVWFFFCASSFESYLPERERGEKEQKKGGGKKFVASS